MRIFPQTAHQKLQRVQDRAQARALVQEAGADGLRIPKAVSLLAQALGVDEKRSRHIWRDVLDRGEVRTHADFRLYVPD